MDKLKWLSSATRITLLVLTGGLVAGLFLDKISAEQYMNITVAVCAYYFGKGSAAQTVQQL